MSDAKAPDYTTFSLPASLISRVDVSRIMREFEAFDNALTAKTVREKAGTKTDEIPAVSAQLQSFLDANPVDVNNTTLRSEYITQLRRLKDSAPVVHMTFAVVADTESLQQLAAWLRDSVHPQAVIDAHIQPALVAGAYIRTPNRVFDLSVRNALREKRAELKAALGASRG